MKICSIKKEFYDMFDNSVELEKNEKRPCLIIIKLKYKNKDVDFAIPFRSNINGGAKRQEYFPLPPRHTTKQGKKHGLHYIKMFPIKKEYFLKYYSIKDKDNINDMVKIKKNLSKIVNEAQEYIKNYESGIRYDYCTDIEVIFNTIYGQTKELEEVAISKDDNK